MQELRAEVPSFLLPHRHEAFGSEGLIWAVNVSPLTDSKGLLLFRPGVLPDSGFTAVNQGERILDSLYWKGRHFLLVHKGTEVDLREIHPELKSVTDFNFGLPAVDEASVEGTGNSLVFALNGKGVFVSEFSGGVPSTPFRIGGVTWMEQENTWFLATDGVIYGTGDTVTLWEFDWSDPDLAGSELWISTVVIYGCRGHYPVDSEIRVIIEHDLNGTPTVVNPVETYRTDGLNDYVRGATVWTPLIFTFNQKVKMPFKLKLERLSGNGELYVQSSSRQGVGAGINAVAPLHPQVAINVSGTMCPDGGVVGLHRGLIFGRNGTSRLQVADLITLEFFEEIVIEDEIVEVESLGDSLIVLGKDNVFQLQGWTAGGVQLSKILPFGVSSKEDTSVSSAGIYFWSQERLWKIGQGGIMELPELSFVSGFDTVNILPLPRWGVVLLAPVGSSYSRVVFENKGLSSVFWRFDELGEAVTSPTLSLGDVLVFEDGTAYRLSDSQFPGQYKVEVFVGTPALESLTKFRPFALEAVGSFYGCTEGDVTFYVTGFSDNGISHVEAPVKTLDIAGQLKLPMWADYVIGQVGLVPDTDGGTALPSFAYPVVSFGSQAETRSGASGSGWFLAGRKFVVGLTISESVAKHPANMLLAFRLYGTAESSGAVYGGKAL